MSAENRSEWAVTAAATAAPLLLWGCGASWLWLLAGGLLAVACCTPVLRGRETVPQLLRCTLGKRVGTGVLWLQLASLALGAGWLLGRVGGIVPNVTHGGPWIPLVIMLLALAGAWRGRKAALASGAVLFWLILLTVGVVAVCSLLQIRWERIQPVGGIGQVLPAAAMFLLPMLAVCAKKPDEKQNTWKLIAGRDHGKCRCGGCGYRRLSVAAAGGDGKSAVFYAGGVLPLVGACGAV